jgi:hypothetical protein
MEAQVGIEPFVALKTKQVTDSKKRMKLGMLTMHRSLAQNPAAFGSRDRSNLSAGRTSPGLRPLLSFGWLSSEEAIERAILTRLFRLLRRMFFDIRVHGFLLKPSGFPS